MRFAVIGHPVAHSKSPAMHTAAYRALGLAHTYEKIDTPPELLAQRVAELRHHDLDGINVTVPHKTAVLTLVDEVADTARAIGAANTLVRNADGRITAHNTDAPALVHEIWGLCSKDEKLADRSAIVIGSGGAARAAVFALAYAGVSRIEIRSRRPLEGADAVARAGRGPLALAPPAVVPSGLVPPERERDDLVAIIQCTTAGMRHGAPSSVAVDAIGWESLRGRPSCVAYDVVYEPIVTDFLMRAGSVGLPCKNGLGMLVEQGALAFELWLGVSPPRHAMRAVLDKPL